MSENNQTLNFWHGARRWENPPTLRPSRSGRYECGPGVYLSNHLSTARKYSKGGGQAVLVCLSPDINLLEESFLTLQEQLDGLSVLPRVKSKKNIIDDLNQAATRHHQKPMPASYLLNLCVNYESLSGKSGVALANWYASKNIDASLVSQSNDENWIVVFNPEKIISAKVYNSSDAWDIGDFPTLAEQKSSLLKPKSKNTKKFGY